MWLGTPGKAEEWRPAEISMANRNRKGSLSWKKGEAKMELWKSRRANVKRKKKVGREVTEVRDRDPWWYLKKTSFKEARNHESNFSSECQNVRMQDRGEKKLRSTLCVRVVLLVLVRFEPRKWGDVIIIENKCAHYRKVSEGSAGQREQDREVLWAHERGGVSTNNFRSWLMQSGTVKTTRRRNLC